MMCSADHHEDQSAVWKAEFASYAQRFEVNLSDHLVSEEKRQELIDQPAFGRVFSDHMAHATWKQEDGWFGQHIEAYGALPIDPAASVLHYAQECFEGLKAYRRSDGSIWLFRPDANAQRFQISAQRLYLPQLPVEDFLGSVYALVHQDREWVPSRREYTLYLRPFMFAAESFLGVHAPQKVEYLVIASPSGPYFTGGLKPVSIWVEDQWFRTGPGGTGYAKCGGNYAASVLGEARGKEHGCDQVCFVDAATKTYLEELGGMNVFVVYADGHVETPSLTGNILPGINRSSIIELTREEGREVLETMIPLDSLISDIQSGKVTEVFACGTAALITPIGNFKSERFDVTVANGEPGKFTAHLRKKMLDIQMGVIPDEHGWMWQVR